MKLIYADAKAYRYTDSLLKISESQLAQLKEDNSILIDRSKEEKDECKRQMDNVQSQILLYKDQISGYERLLKKQRRKTLLTGAAGFITTGIAVYFFSQK